MFVARHFFDSPMNWQLLEVESNQMYARLINRLLTKGVDAGWHPLIKVFNKGDKTC